LIIATLNHERFNLNCSPFKTFWIWPATTG
jgi:hypothetical protein